MAGAAVECAVQSRRARWLTVAAVALPTAAIAEAPPQRTPPWRHHVFVGLTHAEAVATEDTSSGGGMTVGLQLGYRFRAGAELFLRGQVTGLDRALADGIIDHPIRHDTGLGVRTNFGRLWLEAEVGVATTSRSWTTSDHDPYLRAAIGVELGCRGTACLEAYAGVEVGGPDDQAGFAGLRLTF